MQKPIIGISLFLLTLSAVFGYLNNRHVKTIRAETATAVSQRADAERVRGQREKELKGKDATAAAATEKANEAQAALAKAQAEKADTDAKVQADEAKLVTLQQRVDELSAAQIMPGAPAGGETADAQTQLAEARKQLETVEKEKTLLAEKVDSSRREAAAAADEVKRRKTAAGNPSIRGTVMAVNQAYNFVVLSLGARAGVEPNSEMLVLRSGSLIGKIRISSVEPATAIGDVVTSSLARGVQVQPGDTVIYAGKNS